MQLELYAHQQQAVTAIAFVADGSFLATGSEDTVVAAWSVAGARAQRGYTARTEPHNKCATLQPRPPPSSAPAASRGAAMLDTCVVCLYLYPDIRDCDTTKPQHNFADLLENLMDTTLSAAATAPPPPAAHAWTGHTLPARSNPHTLSPLPFSHAPLWRPRRFGMLFCFAVVESPCALCSPRHALIMRTRVRIRLPACPYVRLSCGNR